MRKFLAAVFVAGLVMSPVVALASSPGHSGDGGNNGGHTGQGGGGSNGQGGGDGGNGHGGQGGNGGGPGGSGDGGHSGGNGHGGGSTGGGSVGAAPSFSGPDGATGVSLSTGAAGYGATDKLVAAIKACEMERPGLAQGDYNAATGAWSFRTYDDTVWPFVQRCMKARGYPAYGTDFSTTTNFGQR